jgi:ribonuclease HI
MALSRDLELCAYFDGGLERAPAKGELCDGVAACVVVDSAGLVWAERSCQLASVTSNMAEYRGLLLAVGTAHLLGASVLHLVTDSQLVAMQVANYYAVSNPELARLHGIATGRLMAYFSAWSIRHVARSENARADWLCNGVVRPNGKVATKKHPPGPPAFLAGTTRPGWVT